MGVCITLQIIHHQNRRQYDIDLNITIDNSCGNGLINVINNLMA